MATAMPPRAWVESERYAQITEAGEARLLTERGARRRVLESVERGQADADGFANRERDPDTVRTIDCRNERSQQRSGLRQRRG